VSIFKGQDEFDLTSGDIARPLFFLSLPIVVTNLMQTAYNLADTFWLGQYSTDALAAISFAFPMVFLLISFGMGISVAGSVLVAQHTGADEPEEAEFAASQTVTFAALFSLIFGAIGYAAVGPFLSLLGASPNVLDLATGYMRIISLGLLFMFGFWVFVSLMRGYGDTITPMLVMFGSVVFNIAVDPLFIFGFDANPLFGMLGLRGLEVALFGLTGYTGSGVAGAAIATVLSRALAMVVGLRILFRGERGVGINLADMVPKLSYVERLVRIGAPASVEVGGRALSVNLMLFVIGLFPTTVVAGYGIGVRVFSVIFLPAIAVARGVETMTGQNLGAGKPDRAATTNHFAAKSMFLVLTVVGVLTWLFARPVVAVFTDDLAVIDVGTTFLRYVAPTFGLIGVMRAYTGGFRGAGKTLVAAAVSILMLGIVRLPVAWVLARLSPTELAWLPIDAASVVGASGIWVSFAVSNVVGAVTAYLWFRTGSWRDADLTGRGASPAADD